MVSLRGFGRSVNSAHRTLGFGVLILLLSVAGCTPATSADRQRLRALQDDPMAAYEPSTTGALLSSHEKAGRRDYVFFHAKWEASSSAVSRSWTFEADVTSATDDLVGALENGGWTLVSESRSRLRNRLAARKAFDEFCGSIHILVSDEWRRLSVDMTAPNSRSEPRPGETCLGLEPEDRENLETLESDPIASYAPPNGELLRYEWSARTWPAHLGVGNLEKTWNIVADQTQALADISDALRASGWTLTEVNHYEQSIQVKAHKLIGDFCALAYINVFTEGSLKLELTPAATLSQCDTSR